MGKQVAAGADLNGGVAQLGEHLALASREDQEFESLRLHRVADSNSRSTQTVYLENFIQRMILRKDFQRNQTSEKQTENRMGNHTVIIKKRYNAIYRRSSKKEHRADALALRAEERRDKLRKAMGRSKYPLIHGSLNGETRLDRLQSSMRQSITHGGEPGELKHLSSRRKRKKHRFRK